MRLVPADFQVPAELLTEAFRLRPITIHDVVKDYDAVMTNRAYLWSLFGESWGWPAEALTLEQDLIDLAWHQKEAQLCRAFNYAVMSLDEKRLLGCVYIDPPEKQGFDAQVMLWLRRDGVDASLEDTLIAAVRNWLRDAWPFANVAFPGRDISWREWDALP